VNTFWFPLQDAQGNVTKIPRDRQILYNYINTQYWIGQSLRGSFSPRTISTRFSIFYSASLLILGGETGSSTIEDGPGVPVDFFSTLGPRIYYKKEDPIHPVDMGSRAFGANAGVTFNTGVGFQLFNKPALGFFVGYNWKFFDEEDPGLIDHSIFKGPFGGITCDIK
jgi:hypothetical protein